jgi:OmpA-OmpF porin, OOP family
MKKQLALLALAAGLAAPALAADTGKVVFGLDYNNTKVSDSDISGSGVGVYGGYRFNENLALEVGYRRLFSEDISFAGTKVDVTGKATQISGLAFLPLGSDFSLFGRLGYNKVKVDAKANGLQGTGETSGTLVGLGLDYDFSASTALRVEFQKPASDTRVLSIGVKFSF